MRAWMVVLVVFAVNCGEVHEKQIPIKIECGGDGGTCGSSSTESDESGAETADDDHHDDQMSVPSAEPADEPDDVSESRDIECHPSKELGLGDCEPLCAQTGCGASEMCSVTSVSGQVVPRCKTMGHDREGDICDVGSCAEGLVCVQVDPTARRCVRMCDVADPSLTCSARQQCLALVSGTNLGVCIDSCDMTGGSCPAGQACAMRGDGSTGCATTQDRPIGATCTGAVVECTDGAHCVDDGNQRLCTQACFEHSDCRGACIANPGELGICRD